MLPTITGAVLAATLTASTGLLPAAIDADAAARYCAWRLTAARVYQELQGETSPLARRVLGVLTAAGVGAGTFVPQFCKDGGAAGNANGRLGQPRSETPDTGTGQGATAADRYSWGQPSREDDFTSEASIADWGVYDGAGHAGNGRRSPSAVSISNGVLTLTGNSSGTTAGMAWNPGQLYGRWEARVKAPASDPTYHALLLLWPDAENWPVGGEVDFMEMMGADRQDTNFFLHYGADNSQLDGSVDIDGTEWHNWAVEWTPDHITGYVDGQEWFHTEDTSTLPPGPMHLCIQLDWFPEGGQVDESTMHVDWVREYRLDESASGSSARQRAGSGSSETSRGGR